MKYDFMSLLFILAMVIYISGSFAKQKKTLLTIAFSANFVLLVYGILMKNTATIVDNIMTCIYILCFIDISIRGKIFSLFDLLGSFRKYLELTTLILKLSYILYLFQGVGDLLIIASVFVQYFMPKQKELYDQKLFCGLSNLLQSFFYLILGRYVEFSMQLAISLTFFWKYIELFKDAKKTKN